jgi:serine/threonine-protein kinase HipA
LFGAEYLPAVDFARVDIPFKAQEMAGKLSISGVQAKLSLKLNRVRKELLVTASGGEYILKPQIETFPDIPENENLCMSIAGRLGVDVPPHALLALKDGSLAYIIKRFDRARGKKIHQEDFFQILGSEDKYKGSLEKIGTRLKEISAVPGLDAQLFFERVLLSFIIGNGDAHLKNFSVIYDDRNQIRLAPAYDIVSSKLVIPDEEDSALTLNGKKNKLTLGDFDALAATLRISAKVPYENILRHTDIIYSFIRNSRLKENDKNRLREIVKERSGRLNIEKI